MTHETLVMRSSEFAFLRIDMHKWKTDIYGVVPGFGGRRVLMMASNTGYSLPHVQLDQDLWLADLSPVTQAMQRKLSPKSAALRYVSYTRNEDGHHTEGLFEIESDLAPSVPIDGGQWVGYEDLLHLPLSCPSHRDAIRAYLREAKSGCLPAQRPPWARPGWYDTVHTWIRTELYRLNYSIIGPIEQSKVWAISCILRVPTQEGAVFFKTSARLPLFVNEAALLIKLSELYPATAPSPLCIDGEHGWMLLRDLGTPVGPSASVRVWEEIVQQLSAIQLDSVAHVDELLAAGCIDRRLEALASEIEPLLDATEVLVGLTRDEVEQLHPLASKLGSMCRELASYNVPQTLMHGDLNASNVVRHEGKIMFLDWAECCITHPFINMIRIFTEKNAAVRTHLRDQYLSAWLHFETRKRLLEAWELAHKVTYLHAVVTYRHILPNLEEHCRQEHAPSMAYFLRSLLQLTTL